MFTIMNKSIRFMCWKYPKWRHGQHYVILIFLLIIFVCIFKLAGYIHFSAGNIGFNWIWLQQLNFHVQVIWLREIKGYSCAWISVKIGISTFAVTNIHNLTSVLLRI